MVYEGVRQHALFLYKEERQTVIIQAIFLL